MPIVRGRKRTSGDLPSILLQWVIASYSLLVTKAVALLQRAGDRAEYKRNNEDTSTALKIRELSCGNFNRVTPYAIKLWQASAYVVKLFNTA